jgi:DNA-binding PadR family transcriptional regulator
VCDIQYNEITNKEALMAIEKGTAEGLIQELRRGTLVISVLSQLKEPQYGYSLVQRLAEKGLDIEQNTLYPLLRRLEKQELLESDWEVTETRPRRYYKLSSGGVEMLEYLTAEWEKLSQVVRKLLDD